MTDAKITSIRLTKETYEKIKKDAEENKRSISKHIEYIIDQYYKFKES